MKSYLRFLRQSKAYTAIMAAGLCIALTFVIIFTCYLRQQMHVRSHYPDSERIYLVGLEGRTYSHSRMWTDIKDKIPELEYSVGAHVASVSMKYQDESVPSRKVLTTSSDFFRLFQIRILAGEISDFESRTNAFVTESFARRHGMEEVLGKELIPNEFSYEGEFKDGEPYIIAGIVEDFTNTVFADFEILINHEERSPYFIGSYGPGNLSFIKVHEGADMDILSDKLTKVYNEEDYIEKRQPMLVRLDKLYFSELITDSVALKNENGDRLMIFALVVLFLLVSAVFNYINLSIANAERRAKEWAIRHVIGEDRRRIIVRIFLESLCFTSLCFLVALGAASYICDGVNSLLQSPIPIRISYDWGYAAMYILIVIAIAAVCSLAVSITTSGYKVTSSSSSGRTLTRLFIGIQFILSFVMISVSLTMEIQMKHMVYRDMNANIDDMYLTGIGYDQIPQLTQELEQMPIVRGIGRTISFPGKIFAKFEDITWLNCDSAAFRMFEFEKIADFNDGNPYGTWVTQAVANRYGIDAGNKMLKSGIPLFDGPVAGIINDIPSSNIIRIDLEGSPVITVEHEPQMGGYMLLEVDHTRENNQVLDQMIQNYAVKTFGKKVQENGFLRDLVKAEYEQIRRDMRMIELFMFIAIVLSCLAFFAMSMHYANRSVKQIAVHKVFGGSTSSELMRNLAVYFRIMGAAIVIALPLAIWICGRYLEQFSYRFSLASKWWIFPLSVIIALSISTATVLWQTLRASQTNPAEALKKE